MITESAICYHMTKDTYIRLRVTEFQKKEWKACAELSGETLSSWISKMLDYAAKNWFDHHPEGLRPDQYGNWVRVPEHWTKKGEGSQENLVVNTRFAGHLQAHMKAR